MSFGVLRADWLSRSHSNFGRKFMSVLDDSEFLLHGCKMVGPEGGTFLETFWFLHSHGLVISHLGSGNF